MKEKVMALILTAAMLLSMIFVIPVSAVNPEVWDGSVASGFAGGDGTQANPYLISNAAEFAYFRD